MTTRNRSLKRDGGHTGVHAARQTGGAPRSRRIVCKIPSRKLGRIVPVNSFLERDCVFILEYDHEVTFYREQPCKISYLHDNKVYAFVPDFLVVDRASVRRFVRLKPASRVIAEDDEVVFKMVSNICRTHGFEFTIIPEANIRRQPRLHNIGLLRRYSLTELGVRHRILCREFFRLTPTPTLGALIEFFRDQGIVCPEAVAYAVIWHGIFSTDLSLPLDTQSVIQPAQLATDGFWGSEVERC
jgi:hypothetical protein